MEAHLCQKGDKTKGFIRPYPSFLCSLCMTKNAVEINDISEKELKKYNKKVKERTMKK